MWIYIRLDVVASQICTKTRNSEKLELTAVI